MGSACWPSVGDAAYENITCCGEPVKFAATTCGSVIDAALLPIALTGALLTFGRHEKLCKQVEASCSLLLSIPSGLFITVLSLTPGVAETPDMDPGVATKRVREFVQSKREDRSWLTLRVITLISLPVKLVARVMDAVIGIFAALAALLALGEWEEANEMASKNLTGLLGGISDVVESVLQLLNGDIDFLNE